MSAIRAVVETCREFYDEDLARKAAAERRAVGEGLGGPVQQHKQHADGFKRYTEVDAFIQARRRRVPRRRFT